MIKTERRIDFSREYSRKIFYQINYATNDTSLDQFYGLLETDKRTVVPTKVPLRLIIRS